MKQLKKKLKSECAQAISWMTSMEYRKQRISLNLDIDEDATPYVKAIEKDYSLVEKIHIEDCRYIFSVSLLDYGWESEDEIIRNIGDSYAGDLSYEISEVNCEKCEITLKGHVFTEIMSASHSSPVADIAYYALDADTYSQLKIHEILALEGFHLESNRDHKLSLFTYFTAIEALVSQFLDEYKICLHEELHYALEHLELDKKIRIVVKEKFVGLDLSAIPIWGDFMSTFKDAKKARNDIAHAKSVMTVSGEDSFRAYYALVVLRAMLYCGAKTFNEVKRYVFQKT